MKQTGTIFALLLGFIGVFAQKQHPLIPLSPTAAALGKYGDSDVSLFTGQLNPSVKLLKIQFNDFSFPIDVSYASSGLKVHEIPSSVGMGMSISGTSAITRQVRGVPDEQKHGYNGLNPTATIVQALNAGSYSPTPAYQTISEVNFKRKIGETDYDGEPDLFNFSFQGKGGKFFFDETQNDSPTKLATIIPRQPLRIIAHFNYYATGQLFNGQNQQGRIEDFEIIDEKGIKYTFAKQEGALLDDDDFQFGKNIVSTWYLTKIETPNGNTLDFNYIQRTIYQPHAQSEYRYLYEAGNNNSDYNVHLTVSESTTTETVLQEILINGGAWGKVEFIEDTNNREDWAFSASGSKPKALKEVRLTDGQNNLVRKFMFNYVEGANRLLLRSVQEFGPTGTANEPHVFEYFNESDIPHLPSNGSNVISREDHHGYYNANTTGTLLPDYQVFTLNSAGVSKQYSNVQYDKYLDSLKATASKILPQKEAPIQGGSRNWLGVQNVQSVNTYFITAINRNPDFASALIGQLKKITYPTKGFSEFVYEANSYYGRNDETFNPCSGNFQSIGSATDNSITNCADITSTFTIAEGAYSCLKVFWNAQLNAINQDEIVASLLIKNNENNIYYQKDLVCSHDETINDVGSEYKVLPPGTYTITLNMCGENPLSSNTSSISIDVQAIPTVVGSAFSTRISGGVRLKEMKDCPDTDPNHCLIREYSYTPEDDVNNSSGRIVTNGKYAYPILYFPSDIIIVSGTPQNALFLNSASQLPLSTTLGQYIGYKTVTVKEAKTVNNVRIYKGKTVYKYHSPDADDAPDVNNSSFPFWSISYDWKRGVIQQSKVYNEAGDWLKYDQNSYVLKSSQNYSKFTSIKTGKVLHNIETVPTWYNGEKFAFNKYQSISGFQFNEQSTNKEQFKVNNVLSNIESITQFAYQNDNHLQLTQTSTTNSKGESIVTQFKFPNDITSGDLLTTASLLGSRKAELLQTETFLNSASTSKNQAFFSDFGGKILPSSQKSFIGGSLIPSTETLQLSYDSYGNPTSFKEVGGATNSLLWGYNGQYPVVYIANGTVADASILLSTFDSNTIENTANSLRNSLPNAHISCYSFKPLVGMLSNIAPNQLKTSFVFDDLNRLDKILDNENNILKAYQYQYASTLGGANFVKEMMPRIASNSLPSGYQNLQIVNNYVNGLGQNLQTVAQQAGLNGANDIVSNATTYDGYLRPEKNYIPFSNVGSGALANLPSSVHGDARPFTENFEFDNSPLNRLFKVWGVGNAWFTANKFSESYTEISGGIRSYSVASNGSVSSGTYPANSLFKKTSIDEQGNFVVEYSDKQGNLVQREKPLNATETAITAYIYNDLGQLCDKVQPEVYNSATSFDENSPIFTQGIFGYKYDEKGRQFASHVPSGGWTYGVFDKLNREVLNQTELQRLNDRWTFTKYDAVSRSIFTGELVNFNSRQTLQNDFENISNAFENWSTASHEYSSVSFPSSVTFNDNQVKLKNFYDYYDWIAGEWAFNANVLYPAYQSNYANSKGLLTGILKRNSVDNTKIYFNTFHYDSKNRPIQTYETHHLGGNQPWLKPIISNFQYNFIGDKTKEKIIYQADNQVDRVKEKTFTIDHASRKTKYQLSLGNINETISNYEYDQVSRQIRKVFLPDGNFTFGGAKDYITRPSVDGIITQSNTFDIARKAIILEPNNDIKAINLNTYKAEIDPNAPQGIPISGLQKLDFSWHIRGGLLGINLDGALNPTPNTSEADLFSYKLDYETSGFYDGNIGKETWKTSKNSSTNRSYTYAYDKASRLLSGTYAGGMFANENFGLSNITYDKNGNMLNFWRNGMIAQSNNAPTGFGFVDKMTYQYNGNRLNGIKDDATNTLDVGDFKDNGTPPDGNFNDYTYWNDGSLKSDANKGINLIEWDSFLNKQKQINYSDGRWIKHFYDGSGTRIQTTDSENTVWDYTADAVYKNGTLYQISDDEGRILLENGNGSTLRYVYEFSYKDHLGNARVAFKNVGGQLTLAQENAYYPFGLGHTGTDFTLGINANNYLYNGKEKINSFGLNYSDYGLRTLDLQNNRFISSDPLAHDYPQWTNYQYAGNMPTRYVDLDGAEPAFLNPDGSVVPASDHLQTRMPIGAKLVSPRSGPNAFGEMAARGMSMAMNFIPYVGAAKAITESIAGVDIVTGDNLSTTERVLGAVPFVGKVKSEAKVVEEVADGGVYVLKNSEEVVKRSGRTTDLVKREAQHRTAKETQDLTFEAVHKTNNYAEQRGLEHMLYDANKGTASAANGGLNKIRAISQKNLKSDKGKAYINAAEQYLKKQ